MNVPATGSDDPRDGEDGLPNGPNERPNRPAKMEEGGKAVAHRIEGGTATEKGAESDSSVSDWYLSDMLKYSNKDRFDLCFDEDDRRKV